MSGYRELYGRTAHAKERMLADRSAGEQLFAEILDEQPRAGVAYLLRAEAYEALGDPTAALADYESAERLLEGPQWQAKAREGQARLRDGTRPRPDVSLPAVLPAAGPEAGNRSRTIDVAIVVALITAGASIGGIFLQHWLQTSQQPHSARSAEAPKAGQPVAAEAPKATGQPAVAAAPVPLTLDSILDRLASGKQRATYGAVSALLGVEPARLFDGFPRVPKTSWVVSKDTGLPTGQNERQIDRKLLTNSRILSTAEELKDWLDEHR